MPAIAAIVICICIGLLHENSTVRDDSNASVDMNASWKAADGIEHILSDLPYGVITLERSVADVDLHEKRFCLKSVDTFFEVFADGESVYSYFPEQPALLGESYGMYIHAIPLPEDTQTVRLHLVPVYPNAPPALLNAVIEDAGLFIGNVFKTGIPSFTICLLMMILGIIMIIVGIFSKESTGEQQIEFYTLGVFAMFVATWSVNDTLILQTLTQMPAIVRLINYLTLIFLPYFAVSFIASATNDRNSKPVSVLYVLIWVNFAVNIVLTVLDIRDYFDLVKISQVLLVAALGIAAYLIIRAVRWKQIEKRFLRTLLAGTTVLAVGTVIDLVRFRATTIVKQMTSDYSRMGTLLFLLLICLHLIQEHNREQAETSRTLAQLAFTDSLTGLRNRLAFHEAEAALREDSDAQCAIIQFDVNNLKKVNDVYGHAEGDKHLSNAARIIRESVGAAGSCFRTGGDEFIALVTEQADEAAAERVIQQMEQLSAAYNQKDDPPVHLDIAYGIASFRAASGTLEKAEQLADQRMYECKRRKKSKSKV